MESNYHSDGEADPKTTATIKSLAKACEQSLGEALAEERSQDVNIAAKEGFWASRQFAEFNLWCSKVGVNDQGLRSIDARLKDVPNICEIIQELLQSLKTDLKDLLAPTEAFHQMELDKTTDYDDLDDNSDNSLLFDSLPSSESSEPESVSDKETAKKKQENALRSHIEDTIDRLHGHALHVDEAGANHRQKRVEVYRRKHSDTYDAFKRMGMIYANVRFLNVSAGFRERIGESFARRRIRFEYLKTHQKKRNVDMIDQREDRKSRAKNRLNTQTPFQPLGKLNQTSSQVEIGSQQDEKTVHSATEITKLEFTSKPRHQRRPDSVASSLLGHYSVPKPPRVDGVSFKCPYCRLDFRADEVSNWNKHLMHDFEPYFCIVEDCKTPFDIPNTFNGLLEHLKSHISPRYHIKFPRVDQHDFDDAEFEKNISKCSDKVSAENSVALREVSRRNGVFIFQGCPFCGGFPEDLEENFPDPLVPEAQKELRRHVQHHMLEIALYLPPYREDLLDETLESNFTGAGASCESITSEPSGGFVTTCNQDTCDCKKQGLHPEENASASRLIPELCEPTGQTASRLDEDSSDFWFKLLPELPRYDPNSGQDEYLKQFDTGQQSATAIKVRSNSYYSGYDEAGSNTQSERAWRHSRDKRTWDAVSDSDESTNTSLKRPRLGGAALNRFDYTVGWVCALHHEMAAAEAMLDDKHPPLKMNPNDSTVYTFGRIGPHNVVIACLPAGQYGTNSAAVVANNMRWSFPSVHIGLMVGIGGGVPGKVDIRLGDVVVSNPTGVSSGVVQYDFGRAVDDGRFKRTGTLNKPPEPVLTAVAKLRANHEAQPSRIPAILADMERRNPYMSDYFYKNMDEDRLFQAFYEHAVGDTCDDCDVSQVVDRRPRPTPAIPKIHYGIIASGNQVMKHAQTRDRLAEELGLICFEMEAAGLIDNFPCLVVRGICDYSDSHKTKRWQRYAAATAAAYAKELLYVITPHGNLDMTAQTVVSDTVRSPPPPAAGHRKILLDSLRFDQIDRRQANIKPAHATTCEWLTEHPDYTAWMDRQKYSQHHGLLWIRGKPGAGKSTLMKFAILQAKRRKRKQGPLVFFFFNARGEDIEKTTLGMYRSLLHQLFENMPDLQTLLDDPDLTYLTHPDAETWDLGQLKNLFRSAVRRLGQRQLTCFIDALDECDDNEVSDMVKCFEDLGQYAVQNDVRFYVCFSSRHYPYIDTVYGQKLVLEDQIGHEIDLQNYVRSKLKAGSGLKSEQVIAEILRKASGVFMWVVLVVDILNKEYRKGRLFAAEKRLEAIPSELNKLFEDILTRDQENMGDLLLCIQLLLYSQRSLTREEYYFAIASGLEPDTLGEWDPEDITHEFMDRLIVSSSKGLAETTKSDDRTVQFIYESVREFLIKDSGLRNLWPNLGDDFEGRSHDRLKNCCHTYWAQSDIIAYLPKDEFLLQISTGKARRLRDKVAERFPFLEYATNQVLYHAEAAATQGVPQDEFCRYFTVDHWIQINNLFEEVKVRRHKPDSTSLLYIAAAKGLTQLVKTVLVHNPNVDVVGGRRTYPLLAAMSEGHDDVANALLDCITSKSQQSGLDPNGAFKPSGNRHATSPSLDCEDEDGRTPLFLAAHRGQTSIARRLLHLGANPNFHTRSISASPLVRAVENENEVLVRLILEKRSMKYRPGPATPVGNIPGSMLSDERRHVKKRRLDLDAQTVLSTSSGGWNTVSTSKTCDEDVPWALLAAARTGNEEIAKLLLHSGADIHIVNDQLETPLHIACKYSREDVTKLLLNAGAGVNRKDRLDRTPLHNISIANSVATVMLLVGNGADLESVDIHGMTPLHHASSPWNLAVAEALVQAGANLNAGTKNGATPLHLACDYDRPETASFLIAAGADVQAIDIWGRTPLFYAVQQPQMVCLDVLLSHGANINHRDDRGRTPLFQVINNSRDDVQRFLAKQPYLNIADHSGQTALFELQAEKGENAKLLVEAGVNVAWRDNKGQTFLHAVCSRDDVISNDYLVFVQMVFEQGLEVDARDNTGRTPLLNAVKGNNKRWIPILLEHGADPDAADDQGWTPLSTVIEVGGRWYWNKSERLKLVQLVLDVGADPIKAGPNGEGLLDMAVRLGKDELLEPLRAAIEERGIA